MNNKSHRRIPVFAYGLIIGLLVGVLISLAFLVFFYLQDNSNFDNSEDQLQVYKKPNKSKKSKNKKDDLNQNNAFNEQDSTQNNEGDIESDSIGIYDDDTYTYSDENIKVAQEQLLEIRSIVPSGNKSNFYCQTNQYDSLLVDNLPLNSDGRFRVEFWASPVKFIGYKLTNNKLILFGFYEFNAVSLEYNPSGGLKMKYLNNEYKLNCTEDFIRLSIRKNK